MYRMYSIVSSSQLIRPELQEDEDEVRGKLFESKADVQSAKQAKRNKNAAYSIGKDLDGDQAPSILLPNAA